MRRLVAPVFVLLVLVFVGFAGLVMASLALALHRGDPSAGDGPLALGPWQVWAFAAWLGICAVLVIGGSVVEWRRQVRRRG